MRANKGQNGDDDTTGATKKSAVERPWCAPAITAGRVLLVGPWRAGALPNALRAETAMFEIVRSLPDDAPAIEALLDAAFGPDRKAKASYRYRRSVPSIDALSHVIRDDGRIVGSIAYWPVVVGAREVPALLLGPLAVDPARKNQGIGRALVFGTLDRAAEMGHRLVLLVGDPDYYSRFGFSAASAAGIWMPGESPERLRLRALDAGVLDEAAGDVRSWPQGRGLPGKTTG